MADDRVVLSFANPARAMQTDPESVQSTQPPLAIRLRAPQSFREKSRQVSDITAIKKMLQKRAFEFHLARIRSCFDDLRSRRQPAQFNRSSVISRGSGLSSPRSTRLTRS